MKKIKLSYKMRTIGIIIMLLSPPLFLCIMCERLSDHYTGEWYVKNNTEQTLTLSFPPYENYWQSKDVAPGDSVLIQIHEFEYKEKIKPYFDHLPQRMASFSGEDISLDLFSEKGDFLKRWRYLDKDLSGKQFFKESSWRYHKNPKASIYAIWVFDIMPEDLIEKDD